MKINKTYLKNGVEVDMPMTKGEFQTSRAIRYVEDGKIDGYVRQNEGVYQLYNFQTKEKILKSQEIDSSGEYVRNIIIPEVTSDTLKSPVAAAPVTF